MVRVLAFLGLCLSSMSALAATQRLGLAPTGGSVLIEPKGSVRLASYCYDQYLDPPAAGSPLFVISADATKATVVIGNTPYPLAEALAGPNPKIALTAAGDGFGSDYTQVTVRNLTNQKMRLTVSRVDLADTSTRGTAGLDAIPQQDGPEHNELVQQRVWSGTLAQLRTGTFAAAQRHPTIDAFHKAGEEAGPLITFVAEGGDRWVLVNEPTGSVACHLISAGNIVEGRSLSGRAAINQIERAEMELIGQASRPGTNTMVIFPRFVEADDLGQRGFIVQFGGELIALDLEYCDRLLANKQEAADKPTDARIRKALQGNRVIVARGLIARGAGVHPEGFDALDPAELLVGLQRRFPEVVFGLDDPDKLPLAVERLTMLPRITGPADVSVVYDRDKAARQLLDTTVPYLTATIPGSVVALTKAILDGLTAAGRGELVGRLQAANLIVISEHQDATYREYVKALLNSGVLNNKVVCLLTCYEPSGEAFNSELLADRFSPRAVIYLRRTVQRTETLVKMLHRVADILKRQPAGGMTNLRQLLMQAADEAGQEYKRLNPDDLQIILDDLQTIRDAVIQVSDRRPALREVYHV